jgi:hypothetical protein
MYIRLQTSYISPRHYISIVILTSFDVFGKNTTKIYDESHGLQLTWTDTC